MVFGKGLGKGYKRENRVYFGAGLILIFYSGVFTEINVGEKGEIVTVASKKRIRSKVQDASSQSPFLEQKLSLT